MLNRRQSLTRRFARDRRADTAVEFAMIGSVFFLFVFGVLVVGIDQYWQMTLDDSVRAASRQVQIGKITSGTQFTAAVCNEFGIVAPNCSASLKFIVQTSPSFFAMKSTIGVLNPDGSLTNSASSDFAVTASIPQSTTTTNGTTTITQPVPQFLLVQVIYPLPFKIFIVPGGVATQNGTSSLLSAISTVMSP